MHQKRQQLCRNFQRGSCQYGDRCKFVHAREPQQTANLFSSGNNQGGFQQQKNNPFGFGVQQPQQKSNPFGFGVESQPQQQKSNPFGFGVQQQQQRSNPFGFGVQQQQQQPKNDPNGFGAQQQKINPFGFGVQSQPGPAAGSGSKSNQFKPFENKWTRSGGNATQSRHADTSYKSSDHQCTDPESCKQIMLQDFENERPLWKLTCYGHWKYAPCDIRGDISYEELRAAAYDDAGHGMSLQSIVERERNMLDLKLKEFQNLLQNPYLVTAPSTAGQSGPFGAVTHSAFSPAVQTPNVAFPSSFVHPPAPSNTGFVSSPFTALGPSSGNSNFRQIAPDLNWHAAASASTALQQAADISSNQFLLNLGLSTGDTQPKPQETQSVDRAIWLMEKWMPGEIPEIPPPDELII
ncbi:hypothetical protein MLD38_038509 [Melastoma candidum]|uniref:Uncharacterized protein n=1 Tax=Melastoma candidum TaxID=119954 RepID=A0ACB9L057_9MYRT|nr:hypothetical protein MLD38_038509 [Melastoma candidum]